MKKLKYISFLMIICQVYAQQTDKIRIKSIDYGVVGIYTNLQNTGVRGFCSNLELSSVYKQHIVSLNLDIGYGVMKKNSQNFDLQGFLGLDILYSQEFQLSKEIFIEPQTGIGYINQVNVFGSDNKTAITLPVKLKILFKTNKKFALGLAPRVNINNINTFYATNIILHFTF